MFEDPGSNYLGTSDQGGMVKDEISFHVKVQRRWDRPYRKEERRCLVLRCVFRSIYNIGGTFTVTVEVPVSERYGDLKSSIKYRVVSTEVCSVVWIRRPGL